ncbi:MAG TPA: NAD-dependent epimerase/dehydratase family protein [Candidatus Saccharimonadales bacterium]|nr:NAD-dependent epimerase/dehydratase family protein [Candidatus Saccharimonadales bacterium]
MSDRPAPKTVLVTGGRGFVGAHLVQRLVAAGHSVVSYNRDFTAEVTPGVRAIQGELFDVPRLLTTLQKFSVDCIIHTAGMSHPGLSCDLAVTTFAANANGTLAVLECARLAGIRRVVNFSSECAYGNQEESQVIDESARAVPTTPYGVTKVTGELLGHVYNSLYGLEVVSLRISEIYGPGLWMPSVVSDMVQAALEGKPFTLESGSAHPFQFVYVTDVAHAAELAALSPRLPQEIYNISGGHQMRLGEALALLKQILPEAEISVGPGYLPGWDVQGPFDISAASRDLGYEPACSFKAGLVQYVSWLRSRK